MPIFFNTCRPRFPSTRRAPSFPSPIPLSTCLPRWLHSKHNQKTRIQADRLHQIQHTGTMHYITLRALAALAIVFIQATLHALAQVEEPTLTTSTTSTTIFSTHWVVVTSAAGTASTYTTSGTATGSTIGITTVIGSRTIHKPIPTHPPATSINMVWEGRSFQDAVLNSTNYYREQHEANPLIWDVKLATYAQSHADDCTFEHSVSIAISCNPRIAPPLTAVSDDAHRAGPTARTSLKGTLRRLSPLTPGRTKRQTTTTRSASSPKQSATSPS